MPAPGRSPADCGRGPSSKFSTGRENSTTNRTPFVDASETDCGKKPSALQSRLIIAGRLKQIHGRRQPCSLLDTTLQFSDCTQSNNVNKLNYRYVGKIKARFRQLAAIDSSDQQLPAFRSAIASQGKMADAMGFSVD
jgi:hypothetical protein